jgi:putative addiction module component (TIGR02574 family)
MTPTTTPELQEARELIDRAMKLPPSLRAEIARTLDESVYGPPPNSDADRAYWKAEIARRIEAVRNGTMKTYTIEETMDYLRIVVNEGRPSSPTSPE